MRLLHWPGALCWGFLFFFFCMMAELKERALLEKGSYGDISSPYLDSHCICLIGRLW